MNTKMIALASLLIAATNAAYAGDYSNASNYNTGYGMTAGEENQAVNPSLRDGQRQSHRGQRAVHLFQHEPAVGRAADEHDLVHVQPGSFSNTTGVGGMSTATATAIGNQLNVVTRRKQQHRRRRLQPDQ